MDASTEDEWEYVYDTSQTETITLTIDLSAAPLGPSTTVKNQDSDKQQINKPSSSNLIGDKSSGSIQFLDLPGRAPYISYQGQILAGEWGETLGSDLIFASTGDIPKNVKPVMQSRDGKWCLLGVSQTTLVARPVELIKRSRIQAQEPPTDSNSALNPNNNDFSASTQPRKPFTIMTSSDADPRQQKQVTFLEQLMAIKIAKGEKDVVYLGKSTKYVDSEGNEGRGPVYSKRDWEIMSEDATEQGAERAKKTRVGDRADDEDSAAEDSQEDRDEEDEDADAEGNGDVQESHVEDGEAELENQS